MHAIVTRYAKQDDEMKRNFKIKIDQAKGQDRKKSVNYVNCQHYILKNSISFTCYALRNHLK